MKEWIEYMKYRYQIIKKAIGVISIGVILVSLCSCVNDGDNKFIESESELIDGSVESISDNSVENIFDNSTNATIDEEIKEVDYEANVDIICGISQAIIETMQIKEDYLVEKGRYSYTKQAIEERFSSKPISHIIPYIYYAGNTGNEVMNKEDVLKVINSAFSTDYIDDDITDSYGNYTIQDNSIVRDDTELYCKYVGMWDSKEKKYYIESYRNDLLFSRENESDIPGNYYRLEKRAIVEFAEADNELGFTVNNVEIFYNYYYEENNPWYLYEYFDDESYFVYINDINWNEYQYGFFPNENGKFNEFLPVLEQSSTVIMFSELNSSEAIEEYLNDIKIRSIGISDIDQNGYNDMILSVYVDDEWKTIIISHIGDKYYGYTYGKYGCLAVDQNGMYFSKKEDIDGYEICIVHISEEGFSEECVLTYFSGGNVLYGEQSMAWDEYRNWSYETMEPMVAFWDVKYDLRDL